MLQIRLMTAADIPAGLQLVAQAGWNQLPADWERFLAMQPDGCFVAEANGVVIGTTATCIFDRIAWVAMVLVDAAHRGRGIGTALVERALGFVDGQGVRSVRLDATALGQPIYEKLGFAPQFELTRYAGKLTASTSAEIASASVDRSWLMAYDSEATHAQRGKFLSKLCDAMPPIVDPARQGFVIVRAGREAWQLGPCLAEPEAGEALLHAAAARLGGQSIYFDTPLANEAANRWAKQMGLVARRSFIRMCRGEQVCEDVHRLWASSGPELG